MDFNTAVPQRVRDWMLTRHRNIAHLVSQVKDVVPLSQGDVAFTSPPHVFAVFVTFRDLRGPSVYSNNVNSIIHWS